MKTPLIKWSGSKRHLASQIITYFPHNIDTYYEPFLGGGSVFFKLLKEQKDIKRYVLSDKNESLIDIYKLVKNNPTEIIQSYKDKWYKLKANSLYYYEERDYYNKTKDPLSFYFLTRTCYNGTIRYNSKGDFNTSHHFGRDGMTPDKVENVVNFYSKLMENKDIIFLHETFDKIIPYNIKDVVYLDPPYTNSKMLYFGNISIDLLLSYIDNLKCSWFMNINGINSKDNKEYITIDYDVELSLFSGNSSFSRLKGDNIDVKEYFYYKLK